MVLHVAFPEKFFNDYIAFVNENFDANEHKFFFLKKGKNSITASNVLFSRFYRFGLLFYFELLFYALKADKVILHSLSKWSVIRFLFFFPQLTRKCYWYLWGGDLYYNIVKRGSLKHYFLRNIMFRSVVKNLGVIVSNNGDYGIVRDVFGTRARHIESFLYPSNLFKEIQLDTVSKDEVWIQVGNSADPSNNHSEALEWVKGWNLPSYKVICPLSYGNAKNAAAVNQFGKVCLDTHFMPLNKFMSLEEYVKLLSNIEVAIFNHNRQQAVGNIITLLGFGKTVYIREEVTTFEFLSRLGLRILPIRSEGIGPFKMLTSEEKTHNISLIKKYFSKDELVRQSRQIFIEQI